MLCALRKKKDTRYLGLYSTTSSEKVIAYTETCDTTGRYWQTFHFDIHAFHGKKMLRPISAKIGIFYSKVTDVM